MIEKIQYPFYFLLKYSGDVSISPMAQMMAKRGENVFYSCRIINLKGINYLDRDVKSCRDIRVEVDEDGRE